MTGIYKLLSPSNKVYIGQALDIDGKFGRWYMYSRLQCKGQRKLYNCLKKHGFSSFQKEILQECKIEELDQLETHYKQIELNNVNNDWSKVLFCELYDRGGGPKSEETKRRISKANKGRIFSDEICQKISIAKKGKPCSEERKIKMRKPFSNKHKKLLREGIIKSRGKQVQQFNLEGHLINEFMSASTAERYINKDKKNRNNITDCCKNKQKTAYGFKWKYKN